MGTNQILFNNKFGKPPRSFVSVMSASSELSIWKVLEAARAIVAQRISPNFLL